ncbi:MAG TPA: hypothetical protein VFE40_04120 [Jatrophihabitantaceae bacterium]|nr:hypothetical protein [Jatrophihabitantaceae bacterium]
MSGVADVAGAQVAASTSTILLLLGINRLAQAAVVLPRALAADIPFAPEKDGRTFLAGLVGPAVGRQVTAFVDNRRNNRRDHR